MCVDPQLLESPSVVGAVIAAATDLAAKEGPARFEELRVAMKWEWFEAIYALTFHRAWKSVGLSRDAVCGLHRTDH